MIQINLDVVMAQRHMSAGELAERIDLTSANLSILKNNKAKAIRFSTLNAICRELNCQPGDIIEYLPDPGDQLLEEDNHDSKSNPDSANKHT
ncbi:helix-turn-helix domain-containing protein [Vaginisenegalia massiliensis]|uniref:helix-turn-helix domain-containing protein n=1 Tax=Vaginisenegalia massiliensis TaxID=2058294 RepID=UPI000F539EDD|nr:helix-turn-helix transcriptional regulator [Vaginisenegalia massiliensis]